MATRLAIGAAVAVLGAISVNAAASLQDIHYAGNAPASAYLSFATGINNSGQVVATYYDNDGTWTYVWNPASPVVTLPTFGSPYVWSAAINDAGQVVGDSIYSGSLSVPDGTDHAFLWTPAAGASPATFVDLGDLSGTPGTPTTSIATAINSAGYVVGYSDIGTGVIHAFRWDPNTPTMQDLGTLGGSNSIAYGINSDGLIVGSSQTASGAFHAVLWDSLGIHDLGTLASGDDSLSSQANAINQSGQVVGWSTAPGGGSVNAVLWDATPAHAISNLGVLSGTFASATGINASGQVTGVTAANGDATSRAFLWTAANGMQDIGTLTGGTYSWGVGINDAGQIAGYSYTQDQFGAVDALEHAFIYPEAAGGGADAGRDQTLAAGSHCSADVKLNGSASTVKGTFTWTEGAATLAHGDKPTVKLGIGSHVITLSIAKKGGPAASDSVQINVVDTSAPKFDPHPKDVKVEATSAAGAVVALPTPKAKKDCSSPVDIEAAGIPAGNLFPIGTTTVTYIVSDQAGNWASDTIKVTVTPRHGKGL